MNGAEFGWQSWNDLEDLPHVFCVFVYLKKDFSLKQRTLTAVIFYFLVKFFRWEVSKGKKGELASSELKKDR